MTARILVDTARIAYAQDPEFGFTDEVGDEGMIKALIEKGELSKEKDKVESSMIYNRREGGETQRKGNL